MPQFDVSTFGLQLFWLILVFGFLYIVVSKIIVPKAENILISRNSYLEDNIATSENYNDQARSLTNLKEMKLQELNTDAENIRHQAILNLETYFSKKHEELSSSLDEKTKLSNVEIQKYVDSFHLNESKPAIDLASFIIEKITSKPVDLKLLKKIHGTK